VRGSGPSRPDLGGRTGLIPGGIQQSGQSVHPNSIRPPSSRCRRTRKPGFLTRTRNLSSRLLDVSRLRLRFRHRNKWRVWSQRSSNGRLRGRSMAERPRSCLGRHRPEPRRPELVRGLASAVQIEDPPTRGCGLLQHRRNIGEQLGVVRLGREVTANSFGSATSGSRPRALLCRSTVANKPRPLTTTAPDDGRCSGIGARGPGLSSFVVSGIAHGDWNRGIPRVGDTSYGGYYVGKFRLMLRR